MAATTVISTPILNSAAAVVLGETATLTSAAAPLQQGVVQNDTPTAAQSAQGTKSAANQLEQLVCEREAWEQTAYRTSNEQLYGLLQRCYGLYKAMEGASPEASALRAGLRDYINLKGLSGSFTKTSHTITKIVKCVFGSERRRINAYSTVLRTALAKGVGVMDVAAFIQQAGGVEEIRLAKSPNAMSPKQKAAVATSTVVYNSLAIASSSALSGMLNDAGKIGTNTVLIGTWQADGSVVVRAVVESDTVLTAALASHYSSIKQAAKSQADSQKAADEAATKQAAINAAAATATVTA